MSSDFFALVPSPLSCSSNLNGFLEHLPLFPLLLLQLFSPNNH